MMHESSPKRCRGDMETGKESGYRKKKHPRNKLIVLFVLVPWLMATPVGSLPIWVLDA